MALAPWVGYTNILCEPGWEAEAIPALAARLRKFHWARLTFENYLASPLSRELFLKSFSEKDFDCRNDNHILDADGINKFVCPYVTLTDDWDTFLTTQYSANTRQKMRRFLRKIEGSDGLHVTHADASTVERDVDILLQMWAMQWGERHGEYVDAMAHGIRNFFLGAFEIGKLFMPVLWQGDRPIGVLGCLVDEVRQSLVFARGGRDQSISNPPPGFVLHAYALRYAVERGFKTYDFLRGDESYKFQFATEQRGIDKLIWTTKSRTNLGGKLDVRSVPFALHHTLRLHRQGQVEQARIGYMQILQTAPNCREAASGLAQIAQTRPRT